MPHLSVRCRVQYFTGHAEEVRNEDYDTTRLVKAVKGLNLGPTSYSVVQLGRRRRRISETNKDDALLWFAEWAAELIDAFGGQNKVIIPIPGSAVTADHSSSFRTAQMAEATQAMCATSVEVSTALRWKKSKKTTRQGGTRDPAQLFKNLILLEDELPLDGIVLMDDVLTSGGHLRAAVWRIMNSKRRVLGALCCGRTTQQQLADPFDVKEEFLDIIR